MNSHVSIRYCSLLVIFILAAGWEGTATAQMRTAQPSDIFSNRVSIGLQLSQYQRDFGTGIALTTPWFANQKIAVRTRGNLMFHEHLEEGVTVWTPYVNTTLGVVAMTGQIDDAIRLYGEGGLAALFPSADFSSESFEMGGYGLFGFEFHMNSSSNYFIEIGGAGTGAKADEVVGEPIYSNGLIISTGFKFSL